MLRGWQFLIVIISSVLMILALIIPVSAQTSSSVDLVPLPIIPKQIACKPDLSSAVTVTTVHSNPNNWTTCPSNMFMWRYHESWNDESLDAVCAPIVCTWQ